MTAGIDAVFFLSLGGLVCGGITLLMKTCYKIKCSEIDCGCIHIKRDIAEELQLDLEGGKSNNNRRSSLTLGLATPLK